jgi:hypothetical protein
MKWLQQPAVALACPCSSPAAGCVHQLPAFLLLPPPPPLPPPALHTTPTFAV